MNLEDLSTFISSVDKEKIAKAHELLHSAKRILFVGNGGSASIASHMAVDYQNRGGVPALSFNDAAMITCLGNDYGYGQIFSHQINSHAKAGDVLVAISSSGQSINIRNAAARAQMMEIPVLTLTGFDESNPLRKMGVVNFYVPSDDYGIVEVTHLAILHSMVTP